MIKEFLLLNHLFTAALTKLFRLKKEYIKQIYKKNIKIFFLCFIYILSYFISYSHI